MWTVCLPNFSANKTPLFELKQRRRRRFHTSFPTFLFLGIFFVHALRLLIQIVIPYYGTLERIFYEHGTTVVKIISFDRIRLWLRQMNERKACILSESQRRTSWSLKARAPSTFVKKNSNLSVLRRPLCIKNRKLRLHFAPKIPRTHHAGKNKGRLISLKTGSLCRINNFIRASLLSLTISVSETEQQDKGTMGISFLSFAPCGLYLPLGLTSLVFAWRLSCTLSSQTFPFNGAGNIARKSGWRVLVTWQTIMFPGWPCHSHRSGAIFTNAWCEFVTYSFSWLIRMYIFIPSLLVETVFCLDCKVGMGFVDLLLSLLFSASKGYSRRKHHKPWEGKGQYYKILDGGPSCIFIQIWT